MLSSRPIRNTVGSSAAKRMKAKAQHPFVNAVVACLISLALLCWGCSRDPRAKALVQVRQFTDTTEMGTTAAKVRLQAIIDALDSEEGLQAIAQAYHRSEDNGFRERLLYVCWHLSFVLESNAQDELVAFLREVASPEISTDPALTQWAATSLIACDAPVTEGVFADWLTSEHPLLWQYAVKGLWKIGTESSARTLKDSISARREDAMFVRVIKETLDNLAGSWATTVLSRDQK